MSDTPKKKRLLLYLDDPKLVQWANNQKNVNQSIRQLIYWQIEREGTTKMKFKTYVESGNAVNHGYVSSQAKQIIKAAATSHSTTTPLQPTSNAIPSVPITNEQSTNLTQPEASASSEPLVSKTDVTTSHANSSGNQPTLSSLDNVKSDSTDNRPDPLDFLSTHH